MSAIKVIPLGPIDLEGWVINDSLPAPLQDWIRVQLIEVLKAVLLDQSTIDEYADAYSAFMNGEPPVRDADPLSIAFALNFGEDKYSPSVAYRFNLRDLFSFHIEMCTEDGSFCKDLRKVQKSLRDFADSMEPILSQAERADLQEGESR